ncbi:Phosphoribosyl transferase domain protein [Pseudomonas chlororaphis]|nr:Phosphoribosyl transferase domain protein [Pseudomonas chlororaphis]
MSIGYRYLDFSQASDTEVIDLLQRAWERESIPAPSAQECRDV